MKILSVFLLSMIVLGSSACSIYKASTQPPPADLDGLGIGSDRMQVVGRLGTPTFTGKDDDGRLTEMYEFES